MEAHDHPLFAAARSVALPPEDRARVRHILAERVHAAPPRSQWLHLSLRRSAAAVSGFFLLGSGICYAADSSVPGELLYPVKIYVNEPIVSAAERTPTDRANWRARQAERRLEEILVLTDRGKLTDDILTTAKRRVAQSVAETNQALGEIEKSDRKSDADLIRTRLKTSLEGRALLLRRLTSKRQINKAALLPFVEDVDERLASLESLTGSVITPSGTHREQTENILRQTKSDLRSLRELARAAQSGSTIEKEDIEDIQKLLDTAEAEYREGKAGALSTGKDALRRANTTRSFFRAGRLLKQPPSLRVRAPKEEKVKTEEETNGELKNESPSTSHENVD